MMNKDVNGRSITLLGQQFNIVKNGLSEAEVVKFITELTEKHDALAQRQSHLSSLTRLAERTVVEAENLSENIKREATEKANAEAAHIIAEAKTGAAQIYEKKGIEIVARATEEAETIKASAKKQAEAIKASAGGQAEAVKASAMEQAEAIKASATEQAEVSRTAALEEAQLMLAREKEKSRIEVKEMAQRAYKQLLLDIENIKGQVASFETDIDQPMASSTEGSAEVAAEIRYAMLDEFSGIAQTRDHGDAGEKSALEPDWALEFPPGTDIMGALEIVNHLDKMPQIEKTEIITKDNGLTVVVFMREDIHLPDVLAAFPQVAQVKHNGTSGSNQLKPRKVSLFLSAKS